MKRNLSHYPIFKGRFSPPALRRRLLQFYHPAACLSRSFSNFFFQAIRLSDFFIIATLTIFFKYFFQVFIQKFFA
jgi:hypothetical protein